jgi:2-keto-myo-inositol isomerase
MIKRSRISLNRIIYPNLELEDFYKFTKDLGLNKIELRNDLPGGEIIDSYSYEQLKELSKKYGVEILTINALQKFNLDAILPKTIEELKKLIALLLKLGYAGNISFEPFSQKVQEMEIDKIKSAINNSIEYISSN